MQEASFDIRKWTRTHKTFTPLLTSYWKGEEISIKYFLQSSLFFSLSLSFYIEIIQEEEEEGINFRLLSKFIRSYVLCFYNNI